ncbi:DNA (cytosine-5-)-methyltransferase [Empedobacter falsenii]|uniref:DNA (cytosine-5-)-methyltransferase n=1 Tax=Algoriella xinjiangensis TaxID=684065 RepID=UPI000F631CBF|nr:DNA (cytosine-5-)-methyltransferase [Algoriella xinjiangensis]VDH16685.1 Modification methylase HhaI [Algoriella xinjiangensis]
MEYSVGSLYAGVGGICLGFKEAGFRIDWANEYDKNACITYRKNFSHELIEGDVLQLDIDDLRKIDVLCAGFPCQPFSIAGHKKGFSDDRGNHFFKILDFIDKMRPKVVFLENVKNLVGHDKGNTFKVIQESLKERDYSIHYKVLNTKDYGNIPHNRERIFIIAFDNKSCKEAADNFIFPAEEELTIGVKDILLKEKVDEKYYYGPEKVMYDILKSQITNPETVYQWRRHYVRENKNNVCPTLTANMGTGGHNVPLVLTDYGIRKLTPSECFELQGFPIHSGKYYFPDIANMHLYKQAGNSVSVPVIRRLAENIFKALNGIKIVNSSKELLLFN